MTFPLWDYYSPRFILSIVQPRNIGFFYDNESSHQAIRVVTGSSGSMGKGKKLLLSWIVNCADGTLVDAKFQAYGGTALIGAADIACELLVHKNYVQARNVNIDQIKKELYGAKQPLIEWEEVTLSLHLIIDAIEAGATKCLDIPLTNRPFNSSLHDPIEEGGLPNWDQLSYNEKFILIQELIQEEIQPYIALDGGGIEVVALNDEKDVIIAYHGACATCPSSTGSTLETIQNILRSRLSYDLRVIPDPSFLQQDVDILTKTEEIVE